MEKISVQQVRELLVNFAPLDDDEIEELSKMSDEILLGTDITKEWDIESLDLFDLECEANHCYGIVIKDGKERSNFYRHPTVNNFLVMCNVE